MTSVTDNSGSKPEFDQMYEFGAEIGKGRYASVKKCICKRTKKVYAAKVIKNFRTKNSKLNMNIVENEITALTIAKPNSSIVNLYEVFYNRGETILILEYATEKDLHIYLDNQGAFEEEQACKIIYQVLKAIEFLHSKQVLHLDIKPENVLLMNPLESKSLDTDSSTDETADKEIISETNKLGDVHVKLCDFSFSQIMVPGKPILGMMGTVAYSAPEVLQYDALTKATDMWSLGVLTHVILTEYTPFGNGTEEINQTQTNILNVREKDFECSEDYFDDISYEARDFIENLIKFKPKQRMTIEQALNHKWFKKYNIDKNSAKEEVALTNPTKKKDINSCEDNKENFSQENRLMKINQNHSTNNNASGNSIKLLSTNYDLSKINKKNKIEAKLSNDNLVIIKDDKNNNNIPSLTESQQTKNVPVTDNHLQPSRKSIDMIETASFNISATRLVNENIEKKNLESAN